MRLDFVERVIGQSGGGEGSGGAVDGRWRIGERHDPKGGLEARDLDADCDDRNDRTLVDPPAARSSGEAGPKAGLGG